jgi:hypothetical protein
MSERLYGNDFEHGQYSAAGVDPEEAEYYRRRASDGNDTGYDRAQSRVDELDQQVFDNMPEDTALTN